MDDNAKIQIRDLNVYAGSNHILKDINVNIPRNKITVILGPSGCGKTTLLKCLNRLTDLYPELKVSGEVLIDEKNILNAKEDIYKIRQQMGLLSQRPYPLPMTIYNNIAYALKLRGVRNKREIHKLAMQYLQQANLWDEIRSRLHEPASRLSIGQQQRLCLARGLAVNPEIILADEPTSALDPISSQFIEETFTRLKNDYTIVLVTHVLRQAKRIADHVVFMYLGDVIEQGSVSEVFDHPQQERTRQYLGGTFN
ncbi:MAG TPA: phosphate ABC transporter ATP-binding protein [Bacteroidales bacterium]|nr:phosphate ABC transporter ATP-binding protein [Bacteroidales bacterium]HPT09708.1 phosphate ABC transporter ATP-binding protein [Bacteroidales bacterium]